MSLKLTSDAKIVGKLMLKLLPIQVLLAAVGAINGIVSSFFASNYVGINAMTAVGLYSPINILVVASGNIIVGGSAILCTRYMGRNEQEKVQSMFSLSLLSATLIAGIFMVVLLTLALFDLTVFFTKDEAVRPLFNRYLIGQIIGILPIVLGNQFPNYLSMENRQKRSMIASIVCIGINLVLNYLFVQILRLEAFGLALASSLGQWVFLGIVAQPFLCGKSHFKLQFKETHLSDCKQIVQVGLPGAVGSGYTAIRRMIVNYLLGFYIGSVAISAFAASDSLMRIFWAVPSGMYAVSRLMFSLSVGEEDRQTLTDIMRIMFKRYIPLMCGICAIVILCAEPLTRLYFRDPNEPVYMMTVWGLRIIPLCLPLNIIYKHFSCYGEASGKHGLVNVLSLLDGVVLVSAFTALFITWMKINSAYIASVINGIGCFLVIIGYSCVKIKGFPRNMEQLMAIPEDFGVDEDARIDINVQSIEEVVSVARQVRAFCRKRGIDERRSYLSGLCLEEMAGNIVEHGFTKDKKPHSIDIRVVHKDDDVILRIRDDCVPFDPSERLEIFDPEDFMKNAGIRAVYKIARDIDYQNIFGLNELTMRI